MDLTSVVYDAPLSIYIFVKWDNHNRWSGTSADIFVAEFAAIVDDAKIKSNLVVDFSRGLRDGKVKDVVPVFLTMREASSVVISADTALHMY